jgi:uncharacterized protein YdaU (DUF1376 family)
MTARRATLGEVLGSLIADGNDLPAPALAAYVRLCVRQATTRRPLPDDAKALADAAHCSREEWTGFAARVLALFHRIGRGWLHLRLAAEVEHSAKVSAARSRTCKRAALLKHYPDLQADCTQPHAGEPLAQMDYLPGFAPPPDSVTDPVRGPSTDPSRTPDLSVTDPSRTNTHTHPRGGLVSNGIEHTHTYSRACARVGARVCVGVRETPSAPRPERVAAAERALSEAGVRPRHGDPMLAALVDAGVAAQCFGDVGREALTRGGIADPFAWAMSKIAALQRKAAIIHPVSSATPCDEDVQTLTADERRAIEVGFPLYEEYARTVSGWGGHPSHDAWLEFIEYRHEEEGRLLTAGVST